MPTDQPYDQWEMRGHPGWPDGLTFYDAYTEQDAIEEFRNHHHPSAFLIRRTITPTVVVVPSERYGLTDPLRCLECDVEVRYKHVHDRLAHGWDGRHSPLQGDRT